MCRRRRGASTCTAAHCSGSSPSALLSSPSVVMPGLDPGIHAVAFSPAEWIAGSSPAMTRGIVLVPEGLQFEAARGIEVKLQAERRGAREAQHHRLPPRRRKAFFDRVAHELRTV